MSARPRCPHGEYKATLCLACVEADRDAWKARAEKAEAHIAECNQTVIWHTCCPEDARRLSQMRESDERAEMAESRATQAEAQAAAMREALVVVFASVNTEDEDYPAALESYCHAFDGSAGRTLLAELEALRALDRMLRGTWTAEERVAALAAVDAAREGE